jgi:hypothetical protein
MALGGILQEQNRGPQLWPEDDPAPNPVAIADLLNEISGTLQRHLVLPCGGGDATALWIAHTHVYDRFDHAQPETSVTKQTGYIGNTFLVRSKPLR